MYLHLEHIHPHTSFESNSIHSIVSKVHTLATVLQKYIGRDTVPDHLQVRHRTRRAGHAITFQTFVPRNTQVQG